MTPKSATSPGTEPRLSPDCPSPSDSVRATGAALQLADATIIALWNAVSESGPSLTAALLRFARLIEGEVGRG